MAMAVQKQKKTAELLQQFNGPPRFGKHSSICVQSIRETSETQEEFFSALKMIGGIEMKISVCKSYDDLPLFLNANLLAKVLGVSISTAYEVMHEPGFPVLRVGSRMVVPKEKFIQWAEEQSGGAK